MDDSTEKEAKEFYDRLQVELDNSNNWPAEYLFKFSNLNKYLILFLSWSMNFLILDKFLFHQEKVLNAL